MARRRRSGRTRQRRCLAGGCFTTTHRPEEREKIRFVNSGGKLKNQLHRAVPGLAAEAVADLYARRSGEPDQVIAHSGGRDVIEALKDVLPFDLTETREVLRDHGNMSSPAVLFALERQARGSAAGRPPPLAHRLRRGLRAHACELWR